MPVPLRGTHAGLAQFAKVAFPRAALEIARLGLLQGTRGAQGDLPSPEVAAVGLSGHDGRLIHRLPGGERQRVHLPRARTLIRELSGRRGPCWL